MIIGIPSCPTSRKIDMATGQTMDAGPREETSSKGIRMEDAIAQRDRVARASDLVEAEVSAFLRSRSYQKALHDAVAMILDLRKRVAELEMKHGTV